jgi:hypothetical protein
MDLRDWADTFSRRPHHHITGLGKSSPASEHLGDGKFTSSMIPHGNGLRSVRRDAASEDWISSLQVRAK